MLPRGEDIPVVLIRCQSFSDFPVSAMEMADMEKPGCQGQIGLGIVCCLNTVPDYLKLKKL